MSFSSLSDSELVDLIRSGDKNAFSEIYSRYWKRLFTLAANKVSNLEEAEEVVQDIFISLWKRRFDLEITGSLDRYLAVSIKYRVLKLLAGRYQHRKYTDYSLNFHDSFSNTTLEYLDFDDLKEYIEKLVIRLPEKCRVVYKLSREQGLSHRQIAAECGISEKTVEAHIGKALRILKTGLGQVFL